MLLFHDVLPVDQPVRPLARDYRHGDSEPDHYHNCAQLIHSLSGVVQVTTRLGSWVVPPGRGVWVPAKMVHSLRITGQVAARTLFVDPLARADLPAQCQVVQVSPLLRELIICAMEIAPGYPSGGRDERVMELILDELRMLPILPLHLPEPREASLLPYAAIFRPRWHSPGRWNRRPLISASADAPCRGASSEKPGCILVIGCGAPVCWRR